MISSLTRLVRPRIAFSVLIGCSALTPPPAAAASSCAPATGQKDIVATIKEMFAALRTDDQQRFQQIIAPSFYAYDGGARLTGPALAELIKNGHASGKRWEWSVAEPDAHVACNLAWIAYVDKGSVEDANGRVPLTWLESAVLEYSGARWRILFLHSTRAP